MNPVAAVVSITTGTPPASAIASGLDAKLDEVVRGPTLPKPTEKMPDEIVPVRHHGELPGAVSIEEKPGESLTPTERELVSDLGSQAGFVRRNVALVADLRASRQRLVAAQGDERRELERNLHDGAQQQLAALAVKLRLAESLAERDSTRRGAGPYNSDAGNPRRRRP